MSKRLLLAGGAVLVLGGLLFVLSDEGGRALRGRQAGAPAAAADSAASRAAAELAEVGTATEERAGERDTSAASRSEVLLTEGEQAATVTGAFLRLIDRDGKSVLAKYPVKLVFGETPEVGVRFVGKESDEHGLIDVAEHAKGAPGSVELLVFPSDCHMRFEPPALTIAELGRTAAEAPRVVVFARDSARLSGVALDATSGEPLAELALRVLHSEAAEELPAAWAGISQWTRCFFERETPWLVTDAQGRFEAAESYPVGRLRLVTLHDETADVVLDAQGTAVVARFAVGPLILLDFRAPGERSVSDFIAGLYRDPSAAGLDEELHDPRSPWSRAGWTNDWSNAAPVRPGPPAWTRLSAEELAHPLPSFLILVSRDGAAKGAARIDEFERHRREPLFVEVLELGALTGKVGFEGTPDECELALWRAGAGEDDDPVGSRWLSSSESTFQFQGLEPGRYWLEMRASGVEPLGLDVSIPAAEPLALVVPSGSVELHVLEGRFTSASGLPLDGREGRPNLSNVWAVQAEGDGNGYAQVTWSGGVGTFRIERLPAGEYRLDPRFRLGSLPVEPANARVVVPGPAVSLHIRDDGALQRFELWITAPSPARDLSIEVESERPLPFTQSRVSAGDPLEALPDGRPAQRVVLGPYPAGAITRVVLHGEGLLSARLEVDDFVASGGLLRAEANLVAGCAMHFWVVDEGEGLAGIVLALDGKPLPASDSEGVVRVEMEAKPARVSVVTPGWELVEHHSWGDWGTLFESGEFTLEDGNLEVYVRRTQ